MNILKMKIWLRILLCVCFLSCFFVANSPCQYLSAEVEAKIDSLIVSAYQTAVTEFPCKIKAGGNPNMIRYRDVDDCLNDADERVDWDALSRELEAMRLNGGYLGVDIIEAVESALTAHAVPYDRVFSVKNDKEDTLLPLSNSVLKFLPSDSLIGLPVYDKRRKEQVGTFTGVYTFERRGGLSAANSYKLSVFQYTDLKGDIQTPATKNQLLLDSYGVPWKDASSKSGFRLTSNKLNIID